jgi:hypothetical protein
MRGPAARWLRAAQFASRRVAPRPRRRRHRRRRETGADSHVRNAMHWPWSIDDPGAPARSNVCMHSCRPFTDRRQQPLDGYQYQMFMRGTPSLPHLSCRLPHPLCNHCMQSTPVVYLHHHFVPRIHHGRHASPHLTGPAHFCMSLAQGALRRPDHVPPKITEGKRGAWPRSSLILRLSPFLASTNTSCSSQHRFSAQLAL